MLFGHEWPFLFSEAVCKQDEHKENVYPIYNVKALFISVLFHL